MDCPNCNSQDIEIGEGEITGKDFTAKVWYASCHAIIGEDVNWGGGHDCGFFIVRESKDALLAGIDEAVEQGLRQVLRRMNAAKPTCPHRTGYANCRKETMSDTVLVLEVTSCLDCPRFEKHRVKHWLADPSDVLYEYICNKANRNILPSDGVNPPPSWCPLRKVAQQNAHLTNG